MLAMTFTKAWIKEGYALKKLPSNGWKRKGKFKFWGLSLEHNIKS